MVVFILSVRKKYSSPSLMGLEGEEANVVELNVPRDRRLVSKRGKLASFQSVEWQVLVLIIKVFERLLEIRLWMVRVRDMYGWEVPGGELEEVKVQCRSYAKRRA